MDVGSLKFSWKIEDFSKIQAKFLHSDVFSLGPYKWKICAYPKGYNGDNHLSIYLHVADAETLPSGWSLKAKFSFTLVDQIDYESSFKNGVEHEFNAKSKNWGYPTFISHQKLHDSKKGYLVQDTCIIEANVIMSHGASKLEASKGDNPVKNKTEEDMDAFFIDLNSVIFPKKVVSSDEEARQALAMIGEALDMAPADLNNPGRMSQLKNTFDVLSSLDDCSILTSEQKAELFSMKDKFVDLSERAAKASRGRKLFSEKELVKKTLDDKLGRCLIKFEKAKEETIQYKQDIAILQEQISEKKRMEEESTSKQKEMFKQSKELKAELDVLVKHWPVYEARMNADEEEEKVVSTEWSKMKQLFLSLEKPS